MAKFRQGDLVRILEYDNPAFLGFEGAVTKVHESSGGGIRADDGRGQWTGGRHRRCPLRRADRYAECAFERDS